MAKTIELVARSSTLDKAVKATTFFDVPSRKRGRNSLDNTGGMSYGSGGATPYQFKVTDSSSYSVAGSVIKMQVTVSNGNDKDNPIAGYLNKKAYAKTDLVLSAGIERFYIYAINGEMYALKHQYASDLIPVLLCATVTVANGKLKITQENFENNPEVPLCGESYGSVTLSVQGVVYDSHTLTVKYGCSARALCNNLPIVSGEKSIPATAEGAVGYLIAYVEQLTVENDASPATGFDFVSGSPTPQVEVEWYREVMSYTLTDTGFRVISRLENPHLFTFTVLPLNS